MSQQNVDLVQGIYNAFAAGDVPKVLASLSTDIVWNEAEGNPWADGNPYVGHDAVVKGIFARCASDWDGFSVVAEEILDAGDTVIMLGRYRGTYKATGSTQYSQVAHIWRIADGKAVRFQQYVDTRQVAKVMGVA